MVECRHKNLLTSVLQRFLGFASSYLQGKEKYFVKLGFSIRRCSRQNRIQPNDVFQRNCQTLNRSRADQEYWRKLVTPRNAPARNGTSCDWTKWWSRLGLEHLTLNGCGAQCTECLLLRNIKENGWKCQVASGVMQIEKINRKLKILYNFTTIPLRL